MAIFIYGGGAVKYSLTADVHILFQRTGGDCGVFQTEDAGTIRLIKASSAWQSGVIRELITEEKEEEQLPSPSQLKINDLRAMAREQGIPDLMKKSKEELRRILDAG